MKSLLTDVVRQAPMFEKLRINGSDDSIRVEGYTDDKMLFLEADLTEVVPEFAGEFGISNLSLLKNLLDFASYKSDKASFQVRRNERNGVDYLAELVFRDETNGRTLFRTIQPGMIGERARIATVNWAVAITPSKAKLQEVIQLTGMLTQVDQHFSVFYEDRTLFLKIGGKGPSSHSASVALATDIDCGPLPANLFKAPHFIAVLKIVGNYPCTIRFAQDGVTGIAIKTDHGVYNYILRGNES